MKYLLLSFLITGAVPALAQTAQSGADKDIRLQSPAELARTAIELEQALITQPNSVALHIKLGFTYTRLGDADGAQRSFERAVSLDPGKAIAHYMLGLIYEKKGLTDKAIVAWKACLQTATEARLSETAIKHLNALNARYRP